MLMLMGILGFILTPIPVFSLTVCSSEPGESVISDDPDMPEDEEDSQYHGDETDYCVPIDDDCLDISFLGNYESISDEESGFAVKLNSNVRGKLKINEELIGAENLSINLVKNLGIDTGLGALDFMEDVIPLQPKEVADDEIHLVSKGPLENGLWYLSIPQGYFELQPDFVEVEEIDIPEEDLRDFKVAGAWHKEGNEWNGIPMFTIHDDDAMDGQIPSSTPSDYMTTGYFSILYPMLESLGLKGCVSLEGRRAGWTGNYSNDNVAILKRLQDERGWEVQSHSMACLGETLSNWAVDSINTPLADHILATETNKGPNSFQSTSIYDLSTSTQYMPLLDRSGWVEAPSIRIKPYVGDYSLRRVIKYNEDFDVDYHWGEWFRKAEKNGIKGRSWVTHNTSSSHANVPKINKVCPNGFADMVTPLYNLPPLLSTATRMMLEGQVIPGYKGESDPDNTFNQDHFEFFKKYVDEAYDQGGWIVMGVHAYRRCWKNSLPGALISEGGEYPDEWVDPMVGMDPLVDPLTPPAKLGIENWNEWYPCPGTRLYMAWELLKYARDLGMVNVTSGDGFDAIGNRVGEGYYNKGLRIGQDIPGIEGTRDWYPHYVVGANEEVSYYNPYYNCNILSLFDIPAPDIETTVDRIEAVYPSNDKEEYYDLTGRRLNAKPESGLFLVKRGYSVRKVVR